MGERSEKTVCTQGLKDRVLNYEFPDLVVRLENKLSLSRAEAESLFIDLKLWLFLCGTHRRGDPPLQIVRETSIIDELWHEFILFTQEYTKFCISFFGEYIHHRPTSEHEKQERSEKFEKDPVLTRRQRREELTELVGYVYDRLGREVAIRWYETFGEKYPPDAIRRLRAGSLD